MTPTNQYWLDKITEISKPGSKAAVEHAECPICFEPLYSSPRGVFVDANRQRVSPHFFNYQAALRWLHEKATCPITRSEVSDVLLVPEIRLDPMGWFRLVDLDGDGKLSRSEVVAVLKAELPIDYRQLEQESESGEFWKLWDLDGSGYLESNELFGNQGLIQYVTTVMGLSGVETTIPDIKTNRLGWFNYFDEDSSGTLERDEVVRALVKTFGLTDDVADRVGESITAVWCIFDTDGSGSIEQDEFLRLNEGLADTIIAQLEF